MPRKEIEALEVTPENFGDLLVTSARQAAEIARNDPTLRKRVRMKQDTSSVPVPPEGYDAARIHAMRVTLGYNQKSFAHALNVSDKTVKAWEQGINTPGGAALRLLQLIERHPEVIREMVRR